MVLAAAVGAGWRALDRGQSGQLRSSASEEKERWRSGCAKGHKGAVGINHKKCEDGGAFERACV